VGKGAAMGKMEAADVGNNSHRLASAKEALNVLAARLLKPVGAISGRYEHGWAVGREVEVGRKGWRSEWGGGG